MPDSVTYVIGVHGMCGILLRVRLALDLAPLLPDETGGSAPEEETARLSDQSIKISLAFSP